MKFVLPFVSLLLVGCQHKPLAMPAVYRLVRQGEITVVEPPALGAGVLRIPKARQESPKKDCDISSAAITLAWRGKTAELHMAPVKELADETGRPYLATTQALESFRTALSDSAGRGCATPEEGKRLLGSAAEHFPLPVATTVDLRYGSYAFTGFVDLNSDFALEVISPLPVGFETARYIVALGRLRLVSPATSVSQEWLKFPDKPLMFRLVFTLAKSSADHDAIVLAAPTWASLEAATARVQAQPEEACRASGVDYVCAMAPARSAANPQFQVLVNGTPTYVALGSQVREVVGRGGPRLQEAPAMLRLRRLYEGMKIPVEYSGPEVLGVSLLPGDEISW